jgi:hypothetical protein
LWVHLVLIMLDARYDIDPKPMVASGEAADHTAAASPLFAHGPELNLEDDL